jgi:hypothetical protein
MPAIVEPFSYDGHMLERRVRTDGSIKLGGKFVYLSGVLVGEVVGLEPQPAGGHLLYVGPVALALVTGDHKLVGTRDRPTRYSTGASQSQETYGQ